MLKPDQNRSLPQVQNYLALKKLLASAQDPTPTGQNGQGQQRLQGLTNQYEQRQYGHGPNSPQHAQQGLVQQSRDVEYGQAPGYCNPLFPWTCKDLDIEFGGAAIDNSRDRVNIDSLINNNQAVNRMTTTNLGR